MSQPPVSPVPGSALARLRLHTWRGRAAWALGLVVALLLVCWLLMRATPSWYVPFDPDNDRVLELSDRAQNRYLDLRNTVERTPLGDQAWSISQDEINSFLAIRTAGLLNADGTRAPTTDRISAPVVVFSPGKVAVAARIRDIPGSDPRGGVGTLTFSVSIDNSTGKPMGRVHLIGAQAGYLPIPLSLVQSRIRNSLPGVIEALQKLVELELRGHETSSYQDAVAKAAEGELFPLDYRYDKKAFRIEELHVEAGRVSVVLAPVKPPATRPAGTTQPTVSIPPSTLPGASAGAAAP